jgi:SHS2 domain-containing protein
MHSIQFLEHTADVRVRLEGDTFQELLSAGMEVIHRLLRPGACASIGAPEITETIDVESNDRTGLLVDFLSEVLTASYTHKAVFCDVEMAYLGDHLLRATLKGKQVQYFSKDIKAVTYHEAAVERTPQGSWSTIVILDI